MRLVNDSVGVEAREAEVCIHTCKKRLENSLSRCKETYSRKRDLFTSVKRDLGIAIKVQRRPTDTRAAEVFRSVKRDLFTSVKKDQKIARLRCKKKLILAYLNAALILVYLNAVILEVVPDASSKYARVHGRKRDLVKK